MVIVVEMLLYVYLWISNLTSISSSHTKGVHISHLSHTTTSINTVADTLSAKLRMIVNSLCKFVIGFLEKYYVYSTCSLPPGVLVKYHDC